MNQSQRTEGIVLQSVKYSDRNAIVLVYTRDRGSVSFLAPRVAGKRGARFRPMFFPLSLVEIVYQHRPTKSIQNLKEVTSLLTPSATSTSFVANSIALFLTEFLQRLLRQDHEGNIALFDKVVSAIQLLERLPDREISALHLHLLSQLLEDLGIMPDLATYQPGSILFSSEGIFTMPIKGLHTANDVTAATALHAFLTHPLQTPLATTRLQRQVTLPLLLQFYEHHYPGVSSLKSLEVLQSLVE